jgi:PIN domain nuclease of toxin-antitoxin system
MRGLLLDTHALIWFLSNEPLSNEALFAIATAQAGNALFVSPISAWEAALAQRKRNSGSRPNLNGLNADQWFARGRRSAGARLVPIRQRIAVEAARVPAVYGKGDPGDCFLIAAARVSKLTILTRDADMIALSASDPAYLSVAPC